MRYSFRMVRLPLLFVFFLAACGGGEEKTGGGGSPTTLNHLPTAGAVTLAGTPREKGFLTATVTGWSDEDGATEAYRFNWLVNGKAVAKVTGKRIDGANYNKGDSVVVEIIPYDDGGDGEAIRSKATVIENTPPVLTSVSIGTGPYQTGATIIGAAAGWQDDDGDAPSYQYEWQVNGTPVAGQTTPTLTGLSFVKNNQVKLIVTPVDGDGAGTPVVSNTVVIANSAPGALTADLGAGPYYTGDTITLQSVSGWNDADADTENYDYAWYVNDIEVPLQAGNSLDGAYFEKGDTVQIEATPYDGTVTGTPVYSNLVTVMNSAPTVAAVALGAGPFHTNSVLTTAGLASDLDLTDSPTILYRWFVDGFPVGATSSSLDGAGYFSKGQTVAVEMTPYDGSDYGTPVLSAPVTIQNSLPSATSADIGAGPYYTNDTITNQSITGWSDADGDAEAYQLVWYKNGVSLPTQTGASLMGSTQFAKGDQIKLRVTPDDGTAAGTSLFSNTVTIANSAPALSSVSLGAGPFSKSAAPSASVTSTDVDGDALTTQYKWFVDGVLATGQTGQTLSSTSYARGATVVVEATVTDTGSLVSSAMVSAVITIGNAAPTAPSVLLGPTNVTANTAQIWAEMASPSSDLDGDGITYTSAWLKNGQPYSTGSTSVAGPFTEFDTWRYVLTPNDGFADGITATSLTQVNEKGTMVAAGGYHTCFLTTTGKVRCVGNNSNAQAGVNPALTTLVYPPVAISFAQPVSAISAGNAHTCALTTGGGVYCWGANDRRQLGDGTNAWNNYVPQTVSGLGSGVIAISAGVDHSCVIMTDRTVKCWGENDYQESRPGGGFSYTENVPVSVSGIANAATVATGEHRSCAITLAGALSCWGTDERGDMGNPALIATYTWKAVTLGRQFTCGLTTAGAAKCWGDNYYNTLGFSASSSGIYQTTTPMQVTGLTSGVTAIAAGLTHTCALLSDGSARCWGIEGSHLGTNVSSNGNLITPVFSFGTATSIAASGDTSCAVSLTGGIYCWGNPYYGASLGSPGGGTFTPRRVTGFVP